MSTKGADRNSDVLPALAVPRWMICSWCYSQLSSERDNGNTINNKLGQEPLASLVVQQKEGRITGRAHLKFKSLAIRLRAQVRQTQGLLSVWLLGCQGRRCATRVCLREFGFHSRKLALSGLSCPSSLQFPEKMQNASCIWPGFCSFFLHCRGLNI